MAIIISTSAVDHQNRIVLPKFMKDAEQIFVYRTEEDPGRIYLAKSGAKAIQGIEQYLDKRKIDAKGRVAVSTESLLGRKADKVNIIYIDESTIALS